MGFGVGARSAGIWWFLPLGGRVVLDIRHICRHLRASGPKQTIHYIPSEYNYRVIFPFRSKKQQLAKRSRWYLYDSDILGVLVLPLVGSLSSETPRSRHCSLAGAGVFSAY